MAISGIDNYASGGRDSLNQTIQCMQDPKVVDDLLKMADLDSYLSELHEWSKMKAIAETTGRLMSPAHAEYTETQKVVTFVLSMCVHVCTTIYKQAFHVYTCRNANNVSK